MFVLSFSYLSAQGTYFNIQFDYENIWDITFGVVETDSQYLLTGVFGAPLTFDTAYILKINKTGDFSAIRKVDFYPGSKLRDIRSNPLQVGIVDAYGIHHGGVDEVVDTDIFISQFDSQSLDTLKVRTFGIPNFGDYSNGLILGTSDNGLVVTGYRFAPGVPGQKLLLLRCDSQLDQVFLKTYSKNSSQNHTGHGAAETPNKGLIVVGSRSFNTFDLQGTYLRVDSLGNLLWWKDIVPQGDEEFIILDAVTRLENGHYMILGEKDVFTPGFPSYQLTLVTCINGAGEVLWTKEFGDHKYNDVGWRGLTLCPDGNYITGGTRRENQTVPDRKAYGAIAKISPGGDLIWERLYSASTEGQLFDVFFKTIPTSDGGFICAGSTWGDSLARQNSWIVKLDSLGCPEPGCDSLYTGVTELPVGRNSPIKIYPNPTGGPLTVEAKGGRPITALRVYGLQGRVLKDEVYTPGRDSVSLDMGGAPPGMYFCTALVGGAWVTRQVVLR